MATVDIAGGTSGVTTIGDAYSDVLYNVIQPQLANMEGSGTTTEWVGHNATVTQDTAHANSGTYSLKVVTNTGSGYATGVYGQTIYTNSSTQRMEVGAWFYTATSGQTVEFALNHGGSLQYSTPQAIPVGVWTYLYAYILPTYTTQSVGILFNNTGVTQWVDDVYYGTPQRNILGALGPMTGGQYDTLTAFQSDFENGSVNGWTAPGSTSLAVSTTYAETGTYSLKAVLPSGGVSILSPKVPCVQGQRTTVQCGVYLPSALVGSLSFGFSYFSSSGANLGTTSGGKVPNTAAWTTIQTTSSPAPAGAVTVQMLLYFTNANTVYIDAAHILLSGDTTAQSAESTVPTYPVAAPSVLSPSGVVDAFTAAQSGFENGLSTGWGQIGGDTVGVSSTFSHTGTYSLKIISGGGTTSGPPISIVASGMGFVTLAGWVYTAALTGSFQPGIQFLNAGFTTTSSFYTGTAYTVGAWTYFRVTHAIPTGVVYARLAFNNATTSGTYYIDDLHMYLQSDLAVSDSSPTPSTTKVVAGADLGTSTHTQTAASTSDYKVTAAAINASADISGTGSGTAGGSGITVAGAALSASGTATSGDLSTVYLITDIVGTSASISGSGTTVLRAPANILGAEDDALSIGAADKVQSPAKLTGGDNAYSDEATVLSCLPSNIAGTAAAISSVTSSLVAKGAIVGSGSGVSTGSGTAVARADLSGSGLSAASAAGSTAATGSIAGSDRSTSYGTGTVYAAAGLLGTAQALSTEAGVVVATADLSGNSAAYAGQTGAISGVVVLPTLPASVAYSISSAYGIITSTWNYALYPADVAAQPRPNVMQAQERPSDLHAQDRPNVLAAK